MQTKRPIPLAIVVVCLLVAGGLLLYALQELASQFQGGGANTADTISTSAIHDAAARGDVEAVRREIARKADVHAPLADGEKWKVGMTPLMLAAMAGDEATVAALLEAQARIEDRTRDGNTALFYAAGWGDAPTVKTLLEAGAKPDARTTDGRTPLMMAASRGDITALESLLASGAGVNVKNKWGQTALMLATLAGDPDKVAALLRAGADVDAADLSGVTALGIAASADASAALIELLIDAEPDVNAADADGVTVLMKAADRGDLERVMLLLSAGASVTPEDRQGRTALDWARGRDDEKGRAAHALLQEASKK